jgi:hypothetical protein
MKKADITQATSTHDKCAIFEVQRGDSGMKRYARLMTEAEKQGQNTPHPYSIYRIASGSTAPKVTIVYVQAIGDNDGEKSGAPCAYTDFIATGFADTSSVQWWDNTERVPLARIKRCVNETQSFVDFFNAEVTAKKDAAKRAKQAARNKEKAADTFRQNINDLNSRLAELGFANGHTVSEARSAWMPNHEVTLTLANLTELVRLAEQARMTEKVGA